MSDLPDYTYPITIIGVTVASIPIDIVAQTIGNIAIDIAAQTAGNIDVNLNASAITLNVDITAQAVDNLVVKAMAGASTTNLGQISNGDFEDTHLEGGVTKADDWIDYAGSSKRTSPTHSGFHALTLKKMSPAAINGIYQPLSPSIPTDNIASFTIMGLNQDWDNRTFKIELIYSDGTKTTQTVTTVAFDPWTKFNITYTASKYIIGIRLYTDDVNVTTWDLIILDAISLRYRETIQGIIDTVDIDVVAQTVGNIAIDITAQSVGNLNVNIVSSATLDIDITAQSVGNLNVNIAASGITLNVNLQSSSITLNVNLSSSSITLNVNISSQSSAVDIDITAQSVSIALTADWGALQTSDLDSQGSAVIATATSTLIISYVVPAGKTLYIYEWSGGLFSANGEMYGVLYNATDALYLGVSGGQRGFHVTNHKPKRITQNKTVQVWLRHDAGGNQTVVAHMGGVLI